VLDRRCYELVTDSGISGLTTSFAVGIPSTVVVSHGIDVVGGDEVFEKWIFDRLTGVTVEGCLRTRTYKCIDNVKSGTGVGPSAEDQKVPKYLAVHELTSSSVADSPSFQALVSNTGSAIKVVEDRRWQLYRAYPCIAQGNVDVS